MLQSGRNLYFLILLFREYISRDAEGSGVPEMKGVLAGVHLHNFLSVKSFIGKWTGIFVGLCGGLSFGRQGAFVHCTCILSHQLCTRVKYFKDIGNNY